MKSPYLNNPSRLADVIAAIQVMATYKFYKLDFETWSDRITGDESSASHWRKVFEEHPEFFRLDSKRKSASLVWRRQHTKRFDVDSGKQISREEYLARRDDSSRLSRSPLGTNEISKLMETAINLHSRALEQRRDLRWWIPLSASFFGAVVGSGISALMA